MSLKELQDFVLNFQRVSLAEMKLYLQIDEDAIKPMLNSLITKGQVQRSPMADKCQTCLKCEPDELEFYEWMENV